MTTTNRLNALTASFANYDADLTKVAEQEELDLTNDADLDQLEEALSSYEDFDPDDDDVPPEYGDVSSLEDYVSYFLSF